MSACVRRLLLTLRYNGSAYHGFQVQPNGVTVQEKIQDAAEAVFGERCGVTGCSRTDAGVHALAFKCSLNLNAGTNRIPAERTAAALNSVLPRDIAVTRAVEVGPDFHARYDVVRKEYIYLILNSRVPDPFLEGLAYRVPTPLDAGRMNEAAAAFLGTHDFEGFMSSGSAVSPDEGRGTVRTVYSLAVSREGELVRITISADGFLYNMVRIITGTLIAVSAGRIPADALPGIILSRDRALAGPTAPACGLYLSRVEYPDKTL